MRRRIVALAGSARHDTPAAWTSRSAFTGVAHRRPPERRRCACSAALQPSTSYSSVTVRGLHSTGNRLKSYFGCEVDERTTALTHAPSTIAPPLFPLPSSSGETRPHASTSASVAETTPDKPRRLPFRQQLGADASQLWLFTLHYDLVERFVKDAIRSIERGSRDVTAEASKMLRRIDATLPADQKSSTANHQERVDQLCAKVISSWLVACAQKLQSSDVAQSTKLLLLGITEDLVLSTKKPATHDTLRDVLDWERATLHRLFAVLYTCAQDRNCTTPLVRSRCLSLCAVLLRDARFRTSQARYLWRKLLSGLVTHTTQKPELLPKADKRLWKELGKTMFDLLLRRVIVPSHMHPHIVDGKDSVTNSMMTFTFVARAAIEHDLATKGFPEATLMPLVRLFAQLGQAYNSATDELGEVTRSKTMQWSVTGASEHDDERTPWPPQTLPSSVPPERAVSWKLVQSKRHLEMLVLQLVQARWYRAAFDCYALAPPSMRSLQSTCYLLRCFSAVPLAWPSASPDYVDRMLSESDDRIAISMFLLREAELRIDWNGPPEAVRQQLTRVLEARLAAHRDKENPARITWELANMAKVWPVEDGRTVDGAGAGGAGRSDGASVLDMLKLLGTEAQIDAIQAWSHGNNVGMAKYYALSLLAHRGSSENGEAPLDKHGTPLATRFLNILLLALCRRHDAWHGISGRASTLQTELAGQAQSESERALRRNVSSQLDNLKFVQYFCRKAGALPDQTTSDMLYERIETCCTEASLGALKEEHVWDWQRRGVDAVLGDLRAALGLAMEEVATKTSGEAGKEGD